MTSAVEEEKAVPVLPPISAYKPLPQQEARAREAINAARDWAIAPKRKNNRLTSVRKGSGGNIADGTESSIDYQVGLVSTFPSFLRGPSSALLVLVIAVFIIWWIVKSRLRKSSTRIKANLR